MSLIRRLVLAVLAMTLLHTPAAVAVPADGTETPLTQLPADAFAVLHVRGLERVKDRLAVLLKAVAPDKAEALVEQMNEALKNLPDGRQLTGLAKEGPAFAVMPSLDRLTTDNGDPNLAVVVRVTDYAAFRNGLLTEDERKSLKAGADGVEAVTTQDDKMVYFVNRKGYAVVTPDKQTAGMFAEGKFKGLDTKIERAAAGRFLEPDVSVYVDLAAVNKKYGDQIRAGRALVALAMNQAPGVENLDKATTEQLQKSIDAMFQVIEDGRAVMLSLDFRPAGFALRFEGRFGDDTASGKIAAAMGSKPLSGLEKLPAGGHMYTAGEGPPALMAKVAALTGMLVPSGPDQAKAEAELIAAGLMGFATEFRYPRAGIGVVHYTDPKRAMTANRMILKGLKAGQSIFNAVLKDKPVLQEEAETYRGFRLDYSKLVFDLDKMVDQTQGQLDDEAKKELKRAFVETIGESVQTWFGTDGKSWVSLSGPDFATAKKRLDVYLDGAKPIGEFAPFKTARAGLPPQATGIMLMDIGEIAKMGMRGAAIGLRAVPNAGQIELPDVSTIKTSPAFIGVSLSGAGGAAGIDLFVPAEAVREVRKLIPGGEEVAQ